MATTNVNFDDYKYLGFYDSISTEELSIQLDGIIDNAKETINKVKKYANSVGLLSGLGISECNEVKKQLYAIHPLIKVFVPEYSNILYDTKKLALKLKCFRNVLLNYSKHIDTIITSTQTVKFFPISEVGHSYKDFLSALGLNPIYERIQKDGKVLLTYSKVSFKYVLNLILYKDTESTNDFLSVMYRKDTRDIIKNYIDGYPNHYIEILLRDIAEYYGLKDDYYANSNYFILKERIKQITKDLGYKGITWNYYF